MKPTDLRQFARMLRRTIVERSHAAGVGHIGSALSVADILAALWGRVLRNPSTNDPDRDIFVLSKGHAALALYAAMHLKDILDDAALASYCRDGSPYGAHPEFGAPGIDVGTGSLGQGLSVACGIALSRKMRRSPGRVFVLLSDAECNEGQVWEAAQFAAHHWLGNLVAVVDFNGMQAMGKTTDILDLGPLSSRWRAFGWHAVDVDGHDPDAIASALDIAADMPTVLVARTKLGSGVSFMEDRLEWHYRPLTTELAGRALAEVA